MANTWGNNGNSDRLYILGGSKITADGDCSHEIKRCLLLGRKAMTNLGSILKSRDITLPTKVHLIKAMVFPIVMYGCESLTIKKAERWRIDAFELWCWRRLLRVPWTARRSNQSVLKDISPEYSLEGLTLKLKLHYFGHLMWKTNSLEKTLMLGKIKGRRGWQRMSWWDGITDWWTWVWASSGSWQWTGKPGVLESMGSQRVDTTEWLYWIELNAEESFHFLIMKAAMVSPWSTLIPLRFMLSDLGAQHHVMYYTAKYVLWRMFPCKCNMYKWYHSLDLRDSSQWQYRILLEWNR